jgi:hypothetical protein
MGLEKSHFTKERPNATIIGTKVNTKKPMRLGNRKAYAVRRFLEVKFLILTVFDVT